MGTDDEMQEETYGVTNRKGIGKLTAKVWATSSKQGKP